MSERGGVDLILIENIYLLVNFDFEIKAKDYLFMLILKQLTSHTSEIPSLYYLKSISKYLPEKIFDKFT